MGKTIVEKPRETKVEKEVDVIVIGGGTAGVAAAIGAARAGATVALVERLGAVGGCATSGRCFHIGNLLYNHEGQQVVGGIPMEIMKRIIQAGGTHYDNIETICMGVETRPQYFMIDPVISEVVMLEMLEEAGVFMYLQTTYCDPIMEDDTITGVLLQNKGGRFAVLGKTIVDCSGEGDVAYSAGVPTFQLSDLDWLQTYGFLFRIGNVNVEKFMEYTLSLPAGEPNSEFDTWLPEQTGRDIEDLRNDWYWHHWLDPQPGGWGVPGPDPEATLFSKDTLDWFRKRWESEREFAYLGIHFFREIIKKATDNGDFEFVKMIKDFAQMGYNYDGLTGAEWRNGEVCVNVICPRPGIDAFDSEHISAIEVASRKRALELQRLFKKYMPGFEDCYIIDTASSPLQRHIRFIESHTGITEEVIQKAEEGFDDAMFISYVEMTGATRQIPYRMMIPAKVKHLLVAGKSVKGSVSVRGIILIMAMGQAAGVAAAIAAKYGMTPEEIDVKELQKELKTQDVIIDFNQIK